MFKITTRKSSPLNLENDKPKGIGFSDGLIQAVPTPEYGKRMETMSSFLNAQIRVLFGGIKSIF
jgi:hypothetical protein